MILGGFGTVSGAPAKVPIIPFLSFFFVFFFIAAPFFSSFRPLFPSLLPAPPLSPQAIEGRVHTEIDPSGAAEALRNAEKYVIRIWLVSVLLLPLFSLLLLLLLLKLL